MSKKIKINNINNKTKLIKRIERECNVKWPSTLDEHVLRGLWNKHNYDALYSIKPFNTFNSIESARLEGIIDRHFKAVQPLNASLSYAAPSKNSITSVSINNSNIPESTIKLDVYGEGINEQHSMDDVELKANNNNNIVSSVPLIAMTHSIASKEFYEVLYEELLDCHLVNTCSPNECIGAITFIRKIEDETQDLDNIECVTLGIKNIDIRNELKNIKIPMNLFEPGLFSKKIQDICKEYIPILHNNIIVHSTRKLYRHKSSKQSIPLL
mmetsp:Transcript_42846/g.52684  ORF Transcript_42846/g.52684 Transcript_42846/m.52684 type:complete len:269 (+) Transcript_42846:28-834(+)